MGKDVKKYVKYLIIAAVVLAEWVIAGFIIGYYIYPGENKTVVDKEIQVTDTVTLKHNYNLSDLPVGAYDCRVILKIRGYYIESSAKIFVYEYQETSDKKELYVAYVFPGSSSGLQIYRLTEV